MFITHEADRSAVHSLFGGPGDAYWRAAEIASNRPWYLVTLSQRDKVEEEAADLEQPFEITRTLLIAEIRDLVSLLTAKIDGLSTLQSVHAVTPAHVDGSESWQMVPLRAVWQAEETIDGEKTGLRVEVLETAGGELYPTFPMERPVDKQDDLKLVCTVPIGHTGE